MSIMKSTYFIHMYKKLVSYAGSHKKIPDILWTMLGNGWKCILNCVLRFICVIQNFNALYNAYTVQKHFTELLISRTGRYSYFLNRFMINLTSRFSDKLI